MLPNLLPTLFHYLCKYSCYYFEQPDAHVASLDLGAKVRLLATPLLTNISPPGTVLWMGGIPLCGQPYKVECLMMYPVKNLQQVFSSKNSLHARNSLQRLAAETSCQGSPAHGGKNVPTRYHTKDITIIQSLKGLDGLQSNQTGRYRVSQSTSLICRFMTNLCTS